MVSKLSRRQVLTGLAAGVGASLLYPGTAGASSDPEYFEVTQTDLFLPGLHEAHEGLRVAQLSDVHAGQGTPHGRIIAAVRAVNAQQPDLVLLTGDYVTHARDPLTDIARVLAGLVAPTFAVLGNHDHWVDAPSVRKQLESLRYTVLQNEHTVTQVKGAPLALVGIDDGQTRHADAARALKGVTAQSRLVLAHAPPTFNTLPDDGLACFSGHTHGGQLMVPLVTRSIMRVAGQPYVRGHFQKGTNQLYVNRGLGFGQGGLIPRLGSLPEVSIFTLHRALG
jgi:hypothetical protein